MNLYEIHFDISSSNAICIIHFNSNDSIGIAGNIAVSWYSGSVNWNAVTNVTDIAPNAKYAAPFFNEIERYLDDMYIIKPYVNAGMIAIIKSFKLVVINIIDRITFFIYKKTNHFFND